MRTHFSASLTRGALGLALVLPLTTSGCWFVAAGGVAAAGGGGGGGGGVVNLAPSATLADPGRLDQPQEQLTFTVADGNNDLVDLDISFQLQGGGVTPATLISAQVVTPPAISTTTALAPAVITVVDNVVTGIPATAAGVQVVVTWDLGSDVNLNVASPGPSLIFGVTDGKVVVEPVVQQDDGAIIGNDAPVVSDVQVSGDSGNIVVSFQILDSTTDDVDVVLLFSNDDFATITTATNLVGSTDDLATVSTGVIIHTISWVSDQDLPLQNLDNLELRIVATDATATSSADNADSAAFDLVNNLPPQVNIIELESRDPGNANGNIPFKLFISNPEEEEDLVLAFQFNTVQDGSLAGLQSATIINVSPPSTTTNGFSLPFSSDANGEIFSLRWDADGDLGGSTAQPITRLTITIADQLGQGNTVNSQILSVLNDAPVVTFATDTTGQTTIVSPQSGDVQIPIAIVDSSADDVDVGVEFSLIGDFSDVQSATLVGTDPNLALTSTPGGVQNTLVWASDTDLDEINDEVTIRLVGRDAFSAIGVAATTVITILNNDNPNVDIDDVVRQDGTVTITYTLTDEQADNVDLELFFTTLDGLQSGTPLEVIGNLSDGITDLASSQAGVSHTFIWNSTPQIGQGAVQDMTFRFAPSDDQGTGLTKVTNTFIVGNDAAEVLSFQDITEEQSGNVAIQFTLADSTADTAQMILAEFSLKGDFSDAQSATLVGGNPNALATSTAGVQHTVVWVSNDPGQVAGIDSSVKLRFQFEDVGVPGAEESLLFETAAFTVDNNDPPRVIVTEPVINPDGNGNTVLEFTVFDDESDIVDVVLQWQVAGELVPTLGAEFDTQATRIAALADPAARAAAQIPSELDRGFAGISQAPPPATLGTGEFQSPSILTETSLRNAQRLAGKAITVLRPGRPAVVANVQNPGAVVAAVDLAGVPTGAALVGLRSSGELVSVDLGTGAVVTVATGLGTPVDMTLTADGRIALVVDDTGGRLVEVNLADGATSDLATGLTSPSGVTTVTGNAALVTNTGAGEIVHVDLATGSSTTIVTGLSEPCGITVSRDGRQVFIAERGADQVLVMDVSDYVPLPLTDITRGLPVRPQALTLRANGRGLLVANDDGANTVVAEVDLATTLVGNVFDADSITGISDLLGISEAADGTLLLTRDTTGDTLLVSGGTEATGNVTAVATAPRPVLTTDLTTPPTGTARQFLIQRGLNATVLEQDATLTLASSPTGVTHQFFWDANKDSVPNFTLQIAATPFDNDRGQADISQVPQIRRFFEDAAIPLVSVSLFTFTATIADMNSDGRLDIIAGDFSKIAIFLQDTSGGFPETPNHEITGIDTPKQLVIADMDGNGFLDIVSANDDGDDITIFLQTASNVFDLTPSVTLTDTDVENPTSVSVGDIDGDGDLDIASANKGTANNATVFRQTASSPLAFTLAQTLTSSNVGEPEQVQLADADGDGDLDVVLGDRGMADIVVFRQTGGPGVFETTPGISLAVTNSSFAVGTFEILDLDGDGLTDIVARGSNVEAFFGTSPGVFASPTLVASSQGSGRIAVADVDGDGDLDIVDGNAGGGEVLVTRQLAPRVFESPASARLVGVQFVTSLAVEDLDADGDLDILVGDQNAGTISIFRQTTANPFEPAATVLLASQQSEINTLALGHFDGDDLLDLVVGGNPSKILKQVSPGVVEFTEIASLTGFTSRGEAITADIDGDGDQDVIMINSSASSVGVFLQTSPGIFNLTTLSDSSLASPQSVALGDVDNDGRLDIATANAGSDNVTIFRQTSPGSFEPAPGFKLTAATLQGLRSVQLADLDADGDIDVVVTGADSDSIVVFLNDGGAFPTSDILTDAAVDRPHALVVYDVDGDGDLDLVNTNDDFPDDTITIFLQTTPGTFSTTPIVITPVNNNNGTFLSRLAVGDVDGDGDGDLVAGDGNGNAALALVFRRLGAGIFESVPFAELRVGNTESPGQILVVDLDGDGQVEIITCSTSDDTISVFTVTGDP